METKAGFKPNKLFFVSEINFLRLDNEWRFQVFRCAFCKPLKGFNIQRIDRFSYLIKSQGTISSSCFGMKRPSNLPAECNSLMLQLRV